MKITKKNIIDHVITIINVYAPTTERAKKNPKELEDMYSQLNKLVKDFKKLSTSIISLQLATLTQKLVFQMRQIHVQENIQEA